MRVEVLARTFRRAVGFFMLCCRLDSHETTLVYLERMAGEDAHVNGGVENGADPIRRSATVVAKAPGSIKCVIFVICVYDRIVPESG